MLVSFLLCTVTRNLLENKLIFKYLNIFIFTHYATFLTLFSFPTHTHRVYSLRNIQRAKHSTAIYHFRPIEVSQSRQRRHKAATAAGGPMPWGVETISWPSAVRRHKTAGLPKYPRKGKIRKIRKRRIRVQKVRRASSSKTLA